MKILIILFLLTLPSLCRSQELYIGKTPSEVLGEVYKEYGITPKATTTSLHRKLEWTDSKNETKFMCLFENSNIATIDYTSLLPLTKVSLSTWRYYFGRFPSIISNVNDVVEIWVIRQKNTIMIVREMKCNECPIGYRFDINKTNL